MAHHSETTSHYLQGFRQQLEHEKFVSDNSAISRDHRDNWASVLVYLLSFDSVSPTSQMALIYQIHCPQCMDLRSAFLQSLYRQVHLRFENFCIVKPSIESPWERGRDYTKQLYRKVHGRSRLVFRRCWLT